MRQQQQAMQAQPMVKQQPQQPNISQQQQDKKAMYEPRVPYILDTGPSSPGWQAQVEIVANPNPEVPSAESGVQAYQAYGTQSMHSEGQDKKQLMMDQPGQRQMSPWLPPSSGLSGNQTLTAMDMYNMARLGGQAMHGGPAAAQSGIQALHNYQMQMMLLEQQNKKRRNDGSAGARRAICWRTTGRFSTRSSHW